MGFRRSFRRWRRTRPFWGGLFVVASAVWIFLTVKAPLPVVVHVGVQGLAGFLVPIVMLLCGILLWYSPANRTFYSVLALVMALVSWVTSNLGGFLVGLLLGVVGGCLAFSWQPGPAPSSATGAQAAQGQRGGEQEHAGGGEQADTEEQVAAPQGRWRDVGRERAVEDQVAGREDGAG
ncbi:DUF6114 domain-containing protein [Dactylosporangium sp. CA-052675]|uniref:DUF6114 domain-containing protein n=1 Tax=Dactylosporangium sp. CA-052675 TaxID=3239927 RepID=UPI003D8DFEF4